MMPFATTFASYAALVFTVLLLVTTFYFLFGGLPLLTLKHDTAVDAKFIRGFFNLYYKMAMGASVGALLSFAIWGRLNFTLGAALIVATLVLLRAYFIPVMAQVGAQIQITQKQSIQKFQKLHTVALLINFALLFALVWSITQMRL